MEKIIKIIFSTNQKAYIVNSVIFYIANLFHYSIVFDFGGLRILSIKLYPFLDVIISLIMLCTCFVSFYITSVSSNPFNILLGKTRCYGSFLKTVLVIIHRTDVFEKGLYHGFMNALIIVLVLISITDCINTNRCFLKAQCQNVPGEMLTTKINEDEYNTYCQYWSKTTKLLYISAVIACVISSESFNLDIKILNPVLALITIFNRVKFYIRFRETERNIKIFFISLLWLITVMIYSVFDVYIYKNNTFSGIEYFGLYAVSYIILLMSTNKLNCEMTKYKYTNCMRNN